MEATQTKDPSHPITAEEEMTSGPREILRAIGQRRIERRKRQLARGVKGRVRAFGRGARLGHAMSENPGRVVALSFAVGAIIGVAALALSQMWQDFQQILEEEAPSEEYADESQSMAA